MMIFYLGLVASQQANISGEIRTGIFVQAEYGVVN